MRRNDKLARSRRLKRPESVLDLCNEMNATIIHLLAAQACERPRKPVIYKAGA